MRFIHTADWHLGRLFHSRHLTEDQEFTLAGLLTLAETAQADAVVIAGDVFDRAVPPPEAVRLLDNVIARLALDLGVAVVMIAGNHDSAARLEYLSELARRTGVHVVGRVGREVRPAEIRGRDGADVRFWPVAYTDPESARDEMQRDDLHTHEEVLAAQLDTVARAADDRVRNVIVGHAFVSGCEQCESERELTVGGSAAVDRALFSDFDYVALGHLHRRQTAGSERVRYSGSLLKYSFAETDQQKSVTLVDLGPQGQLSVREVALPIKRDVRRIRGAFDELLSRDVDEGLSEAYVEVILTDPDPVPNPVDKLRKRFPFLLSLRREEAQLPALGGPSGSTGIKTRSTADLFADFFRDVSGRAVTEAQAAEVAAVLNQVERGAREAPAVSRQAGRVEAGGRPGDAPAGGERAAAGHPGAGSEQASVAEPVVYGKRVAASEPVSAGVDSPTGEAAAGAQVVSA
jgi:DNA repair protein SbcD/Mre11